MTNQQGAPEALDDLYLKLQGLSKRLEGSGLIDEDDAPEAYPAILAAMNLVWRLQREQSAALVDAQQPAPSAAAATEVENLRKALQFYADKDHFNIADEGAWDTVSGEPQNYWCDEEGTATVEDGTIARLALAGHQIKFDADEAPQPSPTPQADSAPAAICNACGAELLEVKQSPNSYLSAEQFDADKLGDWYCKCCPKGPSEGSSTHRYFWNRDLGASAPQADSATSAAAALPEGWVPLVITHEGQYPEEVAYGPQVLMDRLGKWLRKYFDHVVASKAQPSPTPQADSQPAQVDAMADSQYLAGVSAGWNAANADNPNEALRKLHESRAGYLKPLRAARAPADSQPAPIDMVLHCPKCGLQHIDAPDERTPDWKNEPHRSHLCHGCGHIWRPADVPTNGVAAVKTTGKADSPIAARAPADSVMLDDGKTIQMTNLTKSLQDGNWNVEYWRGYGFTANNRTTTNGSLSFLLRCVNTPENQAAVMQFAREVAKIDQDAARQVARIDAANAARKQGANHD